MRHMKKWIASAACLASLLLTGCVSTVDIATDTPDQVTSSTLSVKDFHDCVLRQGPEADRALLQINEFEDGWTIRMGVGVLYPDTLFIIVVKPQGAGSQVAIYSPDFKRAADRVANRYVQPCLGNVT